MDSSLISQKYNPEFTFLSSGPNAANKGYPNANTTDLIDQLRYINQVSSAGDALRNRERRQADRP